MSQLQIIWKNLFLTRNLRSCRWSGKQTSAWEWAKTSGILFNKCLKTFWNKKHSQCLLTPNTKVADDWQAWVTEPRWPEGAFNSQLAGRVASLHQIASWQLRVCRVGGQHWWESCSVDARTHTLPLPALAKQGGRISCSRKKGKHESQSWQAGPRGLMGSKQTPRTPSDPQRLVLVSVLCSVNAASTKQALQAQMKELYNVLCFQCVKPKLGEPS